MCIPDYRQVTTKQNKSSGIRTTSPELYRAARHTIDTYGEGGEIGSTGIGEVMPVGCAVHYGVVEDSHVGLRESHSGFMDCVRDVNAY